jgi:hypothetical protein
MDAAFLEPLTLRGGHALLVPLSPDHHDDLVDSVKDGELRKLWYTTVPAPERMRADIERRLALQAAGSALPFAVLDAATGTAVGMRVEMRFAHLKTHHGFERMRLRGLSGARDEFYLAAIVQNLKTMAIRLLKPPPDLAPA